MRKFGETYAGIVKLVVIANEADQSNNTWCEPDGDRHKYIKMVATAHKALIDANPANQIQISDSGMMGGTVSRLALADLIKQRQEAVSQGRSFPREKLLSLIELEDDLTDQNYAVSISSDGEVLVKGKPLDWAAIVAANTETEKSALVRNGNAIVDGLNDHVIDATTQLQTYVFKQAHKTVSVFWVANTSDHRNVTRAVSSGCRAYDVFGVEQSVLAITEVPVFQECRR